MSEYKIFGKDITIKGVDRIEKINGELLYQAVNEPEVFLIRDNKKCWIQDSRTYEKLGLEWGHPINKLELADLNAKYKTGDTILWKDGDFVVGDRPRDIYFPPEVEIRKWAILGGFLPGAMDVWKDLGGTHLYGFHFNGMNHFDKAANLGLKLFQFYPADCTWQDIEENLKELKGHPGFGGCWADKYHEPDCFHPGSIPWRKEFYQRKTTIIPDTQNCPTLLIMDMTSANGYTGWEGEWSDDDHDISMIDFYPHKEEDFNRDKEKALYFVRTFEKTHQMIPQPGLWTEPIEWLWDFYCWWKEMLASSEWDNPYRGTKAMAFWEWIKLQGNPEMQQVVRRIIEDVRS